MGQSFGLIGNQAQGLVQLPVDVAASDNVGAQILGASGDKKAALPRLGAAQ